MSNKTKTVKREKEQDWGGPTPWIICVISRPKFSNNKKDRREREIIPRSLRKEKGRGKGNSKRGSVRRAVVQDQRNKKIYQHLDPLIRWLLCFHFWFHGRAQPFLGTYTFHTRKKTEGGQKGGGPTLAALQQNYLRVLSAAKPTTGHNVLQASLHMWCMPFSWQDLEAMPVFHQIGW